MIGAGFFALMGKATAIALGLLWAVSVWAEDCHPELGADARERSYCRAAVDPASIKMLDGSTVPSPSQIWVYVTKPPIQIE